MSEDHKDSEQPRVGILYCGGAMSSVGELTGVAAFEAMKRLGPDLIGMACVSALATDVPKHRRTLDSFEKVLVIDGCANYCVRTLTEAKGVRVDGYINLCMDLKLKKIGPFEPLAYTDEDLEKTLDAIIAEVKNLLGIAEEGST